VAAAGDCVERARPLAEQAQFRDWTSQYERLQIELWLVQDRLRAAVHWSDEMLRSAALSARPEGVVTRLAIGRLQIVKGNGPSVTEAQALPGRLLEIAAAEGQAGITIEALARLALAHWRRGDELAALTSLERALHLAETEGYVRTLADLDLPPA
jgi:LuxR family maltose regulon positive regulatory protein